MRRRLGTAVAMGCAAVLLSPGLGQAAEPALRFDFNDVATTQPDGGPAISGCLAGSGEDAKIGCVVARGRGEVQAVAGASGRPGDWALRFPGPGQGTAVLEVADAPDLNPDTKDFTATAQVRLDTLPGPSGYNVIQKGRYRTRGGQWKMQVDQAGPDCRVAGRRGKTESGTLVAAPRQLPLHEWHTITCVRHGDQLRILIDGQERGATSGADLDVSNDAPVLIAGKHSGAPNDQLHGAVDNVGLTID